MKYKDAIIALILLAIFLIGVCTVLYFATMLLNKVIFWFITTILIWRL